MRFSTGIVATALAAGSGAALLNQPIVWFAAETPASTQEEAPPEDSPQEDSTTGNDVPEPLLQLTSTVVTETLVRASESNADLGFGDSRDLGARRQGTITWIPEVGDTIEPGDVLWKIDEESIYYVPGEIPMYRSLYKGVKKGDDILQLESFLIGEGYGPDAWEADNSFNNTTRLAVKAFQKDAGMTQDGLIAVGDIVMGDEALRIESRASAGDPAENGAVLTVTSAEAKVTLTTSSRGLDEFQQTPVVTVVLADGRELPAKLDKTKATPANEQGNFGYELTYIVEGSIPDAQPVKVKLETVLATDAMTIPVDALVALTEGGYAVEVATEGSVALRAVEIIDFDDTRVAITGDIEVGDEVVVPS